MWKMTWAETRLASRLFFGKGFHNFFRCNGDFIDAHPNSVVHGIGNRGHDGQKRALPYLLCAEWALRIRLFDQLGDYFRHVQRRGALVFEDRTELVNQRMRKFFRKAPEFLLLHQCLTESHVDAAFDLTTRERRI